MPRTPPAAWALLVLLPLVVTCGGRDDGRDARGAEEEASARPEPLPAGAEAWSLTGEALFPAELSPDELEDRQAKLSTALAELEASPGDPDALVWAGRRHAYLGHYRAAMEIFGEGATLHPRDARFMRHRGHRHITVRDFDEAIADFRVALDLIEGQPDEVEPDGLPNARGIPTGTLHFNIWYHLGLAHYLNGDFELARAAYLSCMEVARNDDTRVATSYWLYMTLKRLGRDAEAEGVLAPIDADLDIIENTSYRDLLLFFKGQRTPEELLGAGGEESLDGATLGYGIGFWHMVSGDTERAGDIFDRVLASGAQWAAFGYIAAEVDAIRLGGA